MKPLETDRVRKLVSSAVQFSAVELGEAVNQLRKMQEARSKKEGLERLRVFALSLKEGDRVISTRNYSKLPMGEEGTITKVIPGRAPNFGYVYVKFDQSGEYAMRVNSIGARGSLSKETIALNRAIIPAMRSIGL